MAPDDSIAPARVIGAGEGEELSALAVLAMPWVFTQHHPLRAEEFITEAEARGIRLDESTLRELYRRRLLVPLAHLTARPQATTAPTADCEPTVVSGPQTVLRYALGSGHLADTAVVPYLTHLRFRGYWPMDGRRWSTHPVYSRFQLLGLEALGSLLAMRRRTYSRGQLRSYLPAPDQAIVTAAAQHRRLALVLTALEGRYEPCLDEEWVRLRGMGGDELAREWGAYRASFDPVAVSAQLSCPPERVRKDAEALLVSAHRIDPLDRNLRQLVRRLPVDQWKNNLRGTARCAMDLREAAEILLRFYEDLADRGSADALPSPDAFRLGWHPLAERLNYKSQSLDQDLMDLGLSPHARVVLAVEGDTEEVHAPRIWNALGYSGAPELLRVLKLESVDRDLEKIAVLVAAPLVAGKLPGHDHTWELIKPPAMLMVAVDPEGRHFGAPDKVHRTRLKLLTQIRNALRVQGVLSPNPDEIDALISLITWRERCYEFEHFSDAELADALLALHRTCDGLSRAQLIAKFAETRARRQDVKEAWSQWTHKPSKVALAEQLWPLLAAKVERCRTDPDAPAPHIVDLLRTAYHTAQRWRHLSFVLSERP